MKSSIATFSAVSMAVVAMLAAMPAPAWAVIPEGDILPYIEGGLLKTGRVSEDGLMTFPNVRVFYADLGQDLPNFSAEPGWLALDGSLPANGTFTFQVNRAVRLWNGADFSTIQGAFSLSFGPLTPVATPAADSIVPGFNLPIDAAGGLHDHPDYQLLAPAADGIYLLDISFLIPTSNLGPTDPIWILFGQNAPEADAQAAFDYAAANVPGPGAVALIGLALIGGTRRRRGV